MTDTNEVSNQPLIKTDVMGRLRTPRERREKLLDEFERSGLSGGEFAAMVNWLEAVVDKAATGHGGLMIHLPCRARVEISDAGQVGLAAALLRALERPQSGPC